MKHRISAGVIVLDPLDRVALVRHCKPGVYDFWVGPGGGVEGGEDIRDAARREALEETGLVIEALTLIAIEQLVGRQTNTHMIKHWFFSRLKCSPALHTDATSTARELIAQAAWLSRGELADLTVFPPFLIDWFWRQHANGFPEPLFLDVRVMAWE